MKAPGVPDLCRVAERKKNMITEAGVIAFIKMMIELFVKERNALKAAGLDVDFMLTTMRSLLEQAAASEAQQEAMKRQTKMATESWYALKRKSYVTTSGYLDMAIAAVSKDSSIAKNFRQIRAKTYRTKTNEKPIVTPVKV
jgi:hypothetical protein